MKYLVVLESGPTSFEAYATDLPGRVAVGATREEATTLIHRAIEFHIEGMKEDGLPIPAPNSPLEPVEIDA